jgi:YbbR domain-containing protein
MRSFFLHNLSLKIIALGLAIVAWIYVNGEILKNR